MGDTRKLGKDIVLEQLGEYSESWTLVDGVLSKTFEFDDYEQVVTFVNKVADIAMSLDHHPEVIFGYSEARIATTTHEIGGLSGKDIELVKKVEQIDH